MVYQIKPYSYEQAKKLNVEIKPSNKKDKKIDVYKDKKYICSIGDIHYYDYATYIKIMVLNMQMRDVDYTNNAILKIEI